MQHSLVLSEGYTASTAYFLLPHLHQLGYQTTLIDSRCVSPASINLKTVDVIVISRYLSPAWFILLKKAQRDGIKIIYFMDDDLFDAQVLAELPWKYRWKVFSKALIYRAALPQLWVEFWVSTPYLVEKYKLFNPVLLHTQFCPSPAQEKPPIRICYHGSGSHQCEIAWLIPIIEAVQAQTTHLHFELFGNSSIYQLARHLPRTTILHPISWSNYFSFTTTQQREIALAPLLPSAFNAARSPTKFYDYARMGAVGLYSDCCPYQGFIRNGVDGFLLDNEPNLWIDKILQLANDDELRCRISQQIQRKCSDLSGF